MYISFIKKGQSYFILSFLLLIVIGTLLLKLPWITCSGQPIAWVDAAFTATSAVCVTGLTTIPVSAFNLGGQLIILMLIQAGGLGIMTLSVYIMLMLGRNISLSNTLMVSNLSDSSLRSVERLIKIMVKYTFFIECGGGLLLSFGFYFFHDNTILKSIYLGFYHAVSAFCNAGFSIYDSSLIGLSSYIKIVIAALIICGGIGMYLLYDFIYSRRNAKHLQMNTRVTLLATVILVVAGTLLIKFLEYAQDGHISYVDAFFQSVTARTAGFNSVNLAGLSSSTLVVLIILMLIGAAPGSTAGGMKVTTVTLACAAIASTFKGQQKIIIFNREIPITNVLKAFTIIIIFILLATLGGIFISAQTDQSMVNSMFTASSALGTVGLMLDNITDFSEKIFLMIYMFIGRIGPLTIFLFLLGREKNSHLSYPEERMIIG